MCGIFGIVLLQQNSENIYKIIINGLTQLQNRGYDSCGLSIKSSIENLKNLSNCGFACVSSRRVFTLSVIFIN